MKTITKILSCIVLLFCSLQTSYSQSFCLQMTELSNDGTTLVVKVEMQASQEFDLADANLVFSYNANSLGTPQFASSPLGPPIYFVPTVSTPAPETGSINIVLPIAGSGILVPTSPNWLEIVQISFQIIDEESIGNITWDYSGGTTQTVVFADHPVFPYQIFAEDITCLSGYSQVEIIGCTNINACNYNPDATLDDESCILIGESCDDGDADTVNDIIDSTCTCVGIPNNSCPTDFNADGTTDGDDFIIFLGNFDVICDPIPCPTDINSSGLTDGEDFSLFLGNFGSDCP